MAGWFLFCLSWPCPASTQISGTSGTKGTEAGESEWGARRGTTGHGGLGWRVVSEDLGLYATPEISPFSLEWSGYFIRATGTETSTDTL